MQPTDSTGSRRTFRELARRWRPRRESDVSSAGPPFADDPEPGRRPARGLEATLRWVERAFLVVGLSCLVVAASTWVGAIRYQSTAARQLEGAARGGASTPPLASGVRRPIPTGSPLAILEIPRLGLEAVVAEGASSSVLRRALGHLPTSARPEEPGNLVIAGHRDTFFRPLEGVRVGDRVVLSSPEGRLEYHVQWTRVVEPTAVEVATDTGERALTLITCYPFRWVGSAPLRFVVRALPVDSAAGSPT